MTNCFTSFSGQHHRYHYGGTTIKYTRILAADTLSNIFSSPLPRCSPLIRMPLYVKNSAPGGVRPCYESTILRFTCTSRTA